MKSLIVFTSIAGLAIGSMTGCVSVRDELFLQNIEVEGSPSQPPIHLTPRDREVGTFYAAPMVSVSSGTFTSSLERQYEGTIPDSLLDFKPQGLSWKLPAATFGVDFDYTATQSLSLHGGLIASVGKGQQLTSFHGGIGLSSPGEGTNVRFDLGLQYTDIRYQGATVIFRSVNSQPPDTIYYLDRGKEFQLNLYANLTLNSTNEAFLNWFFQLGINPQSLTSFVPRKDASGTPGPYAVSDLRAESSLFWISATPGLSLTLPEGRRLLIGVRILKELSSESARPGVILIPMVQFDWKL